MPLKQNQLRALEWLLCTSSDVKYLPLHEKPIIFSVTVLWPAKQCANPEKPSTVGSGGVFNVIN